MAIGKRQNYKESPEEELDHLLEELALMHEQREFIESMRQDGVDKNNALTEIYENNNGMAACFPI